MIPKCSLICQDFKNHISYNSTETAHSLGKAHPEVQHLDALDLVVKKTAPLSPHNPHFREEISL